MRVRARNKQVFGLYRVSARSHESSSSETYKVILLRAQSLPTMGEKGEAWQVSAIRIQVIRPQGGNFDNRR
jgi:hypothetical protein